MSIYFKKLSHRKSRLKDVLQGNYDQGITVLVEKSRYVNQRNRLETLKLIPTSTTN